jgi:hypothetical protein
MSFSELLKHLQLSFELSTLVFRRRNVDKDFSSIKGGIDHGVVGNPAFLADLIGERSVVEVNDEAADRNIALSSHILDYLWEHKLSYISRVLPS